MPVVMAGGLVLAAGLYSQAVAGTQDFTLVNKSGVVINNLYVSEAKSDDWEEDVLGDEVLEDGESIKVTFKGRKACIWDLMVKDEEDEGLYWRGINLCEVSKVILKCNKKECYAEFE